MSDSHLIWRWRNGVSENCCAFSPWDWNQPSILRRHRRSWNKLFSQGSLYKMQVNADSPVEFPVFVSFNKNFSIYSFTVRMEVCLLNVGSNQLTMHWAEWRRVYCQFMQSHPKPTPRTYLAAGFRMALVIPPLQEDFLIAVTSIIPLSWRNQIL